MKIVFHRKPSGIAWKITKDNVSIGYLLRDNTGYTIDLDKNKRAGPFSTMEIARSWIKKNT